MNKLTISIIVFITACSSNRVLLHPQAINDQTISYVRGNTKIHSQSALHPELSIIDYSHDELIIALSITNPNIEPILFSDKNIVVSHVTEEGMQAVSVYSFEQLVAESTGGVDGSIAQVGDTAVGIGAGFVPFGGMAYSVGKLFYSIGTKDSDAHQKRIDKLTGSQLHNNYLRQQTIKPGGNYSGILKIGLENELQAGDTLIFQLSAGKESEKFNFFCKNPQLK